MADKQKKASEKNAADIERENKSLYEMESNELAKLLDYWYKKANDSLGKQRQIWDYSYLTYKGIITHAQVNQNRKEAADAFGLYVNVPRTYSIIEGVRRNFNIENLKVNLIAGDDSSAEDMEKLTKTVKINNMLNYDLRRSRSFKEIKDAGFYKLLYGNGFLHSFLLDRQGNFAEIGNEDPDEEEGRIKPADQKKNLRRYYGMVTRAISPYRVFPDPDGKTLDVNDSNKQLAKYTCIRNVIHINDFRRKWRGVVPDKILDEKVQPGGKDMTNYEAVKEVTDYIFGMDGMRYPGTTQDYVKQSGVQADYKGTNYVEERLWMGEDFYILQAGKDLQFCLIAPNYNPKNRINLTKLNNIEMPDEFWSLGEPYLNRYQQIEENRVHNAVLDSIHFAISGMLAVDTQYLEDEEDTAVYPQKTWKLKMQPGAKISDVMQQFHPTANNANTAMNFMQEVKKIGQETTAITDFVTGASESIAETATETDRLSSASDLAVMDKIKEMAKGALVDVSKKFMDMYPVAYNKEKIEFVEEDAQLIFLGKTREEVTTKELTEIFQDYKETEIIFIDEINMDEPDFRVLGDITIDRSSRINQWSVAIDFATKINEQAYEMGDGRRIDTIKMGMNGLGNFDIIDDPWDYQISGQPTKQEEMEKERQAQLQQQKQQQQQQGQGQKTSSGNQQNRQNEGGRPSRAKTSRVQSTQNQKRQESQPNFRGRNRDQRRTNT